MLPVGHMGATGGAASATAAIWIRRRVRKLLRDAPAESKIQDRIRRRQKFVLAGMAFTGCATLVSGGIDRIESQLGFGHRTAGHSLPILTGVYATARIAQRTGTDVVQRLCDKAGISESVNDVLATLDDLTAWVLNGGLVGAVTHILGDIPTLGHGGTALRLLYPLVNSKFNIGLVSATCPLLNESMLAVGGVLAAVSWGLVLSYLVRPDPPKPLHDTMPAKVLHDVFKSVPTAEELYEMARQYANRIKHYLQDTARTTSNYTVANMTLISSSVEKELPGVASLRRENRTPQNAGVPLRSQRPSSRMITSAPLTSETGNTQSPKSTSLRSPSSTLM